MTFKEISNSLVLDGFLSDLSWGKIVISLVITLIISFQIFFTYRKYTERNFYSRSFNISLALIPLITTSIILAMQSNLVISLGMVGALSIVRYRTAIKSPMDLFFIFWAISVGIICGASQYLLAIIMSVVVFITLWFLMQIDYSKKLQILICRCNKTTNLEKLETELQKIVPVQVKSRQITPEFIEIIYEFKSARNMELMTFLSNKEQVENFRILSNE